MATSRTGERKIAGAIWSLEYEDSRCQSELECRGHARRHGDQSDGPITLRMQGSKSSVGKWSDDRNMLSFRLAGANHPGWEAFLPSLCTRGMKTLY